MKAALLLWTCLFPGLVAQDTVTPGVSGRAEWIWRSAAPAVGEQLRFRRPFRLPGAAASLELAMTCDDRFTLWLDGEELASGEGVQQLVALSAPVALAVGEHLLEVEAANQDGPAGLLGRLRFRDAGGDLVGSVVTDGRWQCQGRADQWRPAHSLGVSFQDGLPWPDPLAPRQATPAGRFDVAAGFGVRLVHSAQAGEGSWIALGFEPSGDALVAVERSHLARLRVAAGRVVGFELLTETPLYSQGFCHHDGALWVVGVGAHGHGLYRLQDVDGDGRHELSEKVLEVGSPGEEGSHAVVPAGDGSLYLVGGIGAALPTQLAADSPYRDWAEDVLLPTLDDPRGRGEGVTAPGGHVLRYDPRTSSASLVAGGFYNPCDLAVSPHGQLFVCDSDMEGDRGLPWYRPARLLRVVPGGEYGWRRGAGKWPTAFRDSEPALTAVGPSAPTGALFCAELGETGHGGVLIGDWAYGRILLADPARERTAIRQVVSGRPLNVTDLARAPDGSVWFVTGGRGTQSGLYRLDLPRRDLDAACAKMLRDRRTWAYQERLGLERRPVAEWRAFALKTGPRPARIDTLLVADLHAPNSDPEVVAGLRQAGAIETVDGAVDVLLALARVGDEDDRRAVLRRLGELDAETGWRRVAWLRVHEVALARLAAAGGEPLGEELRTLLTERLGPLYPCGDPLADRQLLHLLVWLGADDLVDRALTRMQELGPADALEVAYALRLVERGWSDAARRRLFTALGEAKQLEGGASLRGYVEAIERDALQRAPAAQRAALAELAAARPLPRPDLDALRAAGGHAWTVAELAPALSLAEHDRDFDNGLAVFTQKAACVACHRINGQGGDLGPDLTAVAARFQRRDLLRAILEPSADIPGSYRHTRFTLRSGEVVVGRVLGTVREGDGPSAPTPSPISGPDGESAPQRLEVAVGLYQQERRIVDERDVVAREPSRVSPMPSGLTDALTVDDLLDLLAYLEAAGNRHVPAFQDR